MNDQRILMLEHDRDDQMITKTFFHQEGYNPEITFTENKNDFFAFLEDCRNGSKLFPTVILLNMNSSPVNAAGILKELKAMPDFNRIPVIVLSGNKNPAMIRECYTLGASSVVIKPDNEKDTERKIRNFLNYWFDTVELG